MTCSVAVSWSFARFFRCLPFANFARVLGDDEFRALFFRSWQARNVESKR